MSQITKEQCTVDDLTVGVTGKETRPWKTLTDFYRNWEFGHGTKIMKSLRVPPRMREKFGYHPELSKPRGY